MPLGGGAVCGGVHCWRCITDEHLSNGGGEGAYDFRDPADPACHWYDLTASVPGTSSPSRWSHPRLQHPLRAVVVGVDFLYRLEPDTHALSTSDTSCAEPDGRVSRHLAHCDEHRTDRRRFSSLLSRVRVVAYAHLNVCPLLLFRVAHHDVGSLSPMT